MSLSERAGRAAAPQDLGAASGGSDLERMQAAFEGGAPPPRGPLPDLGLPTAIPATSYSARQLAMQYGLASDPAYVAAPPLCYMLERLEEWACAELQPNRPAGYGAVKATTWAGHRDCILRFLGEGSVWAAQRLARACAPPSLAQRCAPWACKSLVAVGRTRASRRPWLAPCAGFCRNILGNAKVDLTAYLKLGDFARFLGFHLQKGTSGSALKHHVVVAMKVRGGWGAPADWQQRAGWPSGRGCEGAEGSRPGWVLAEARERPMVTRAALPALPLLHRCSTSWPPPPPWPPPTRGAP